MFSFLSQLFDYKIIISVIFIIIILKVILSVISRNSRQKKQIIFNGMSLPKNMTFHRYSDTESERNQSSDKKEPRCLVVMNTWLLAKERHIDKYRQLWYRRKFDVLVVKTLPMDILLPPFGSQLIAKNTVEILLKLNNEYKDIVFHTLSIGGYMLGEMMVELMSKSSVEHSNLIQSIKGVVSDSLVLATDCATGLSKTLTTNSVKQYLLGKTISLFLTLFHNITVKNYINSQKSCFNSCWKKPGLFFYSRDEVLINIPNLENFIQELKDFGIDIFVKSWDVSGHVQHYKNNTEEYIQELDAFLKSLKLM